MGTLALTILGAIWGSQLGRTVTIAGGLFLAGAAGGFIKGYTYADAPGAAKAAREARDVYWQAELRKANAVQLKQMAAAIEAGKAIADVPPGRDALVRLCAGPKADPDCREKGLHGLQGVR
jgi:hypothetical protein